MQKQLKESLKRSLKGALPISVMLLLASAATAQSPKNGAKDTTNHLLEEVIISASRADNKTPLTTTTMSRRQLDENKIDKSVPYMLELQPSVVATGENGTVGNTSMTIRGVDASRINVNINGITLNDPESQSVFWVNIPNLAGMAQSLQIQRGIGAGAGGGSSFGGAVNLQTLNARSLPYAEVDMSLGSWNTRQYGLTAGTGIGRKGFAFDVAYNGLTSDGYVRGSAADMQSLFMSAGYYGARSLLKAVVILGQQSTGICWDGADSATLREDPTYNSDGMYYDELGNVRYYDNEKDYYYQRHYQLFYSFLPNEHWTLNAAVDFTHGDGYDERYKYNKKPSYCGMENILTGRTDFILQKKMLNSAYTESFSAKYNRNAFTLTMGESFLYYDGDHYGKVIWTKDTTDNVSKDNPFEWYRNTGVKKDATVFARMNYDFSTRSNVFADMQLRYVTYDINGTDDDYPTLNFSEKYPFFNPKVGWNYMISPNRRFYAVAGINHREPTRADIKDACNSGKEIKAEEMMDVELGYALQDTKFVFHGNVYAMLYKDQLTPSGQISNSGYALMENVNKSYRLGVELEAGYRFADWFSLDGNLTLSVNKIIDYKYHYNSYYNDWDTYLDTTFALGNTTLSMSPSIVGAGIATFRPAKDWKVQLIGKYVGRQYCDNTSREDMLLDGYFVMNLRTSYTWHMSDHNEFELQLAVNNVLNNKYRTNAYVYDFYYSNGSFDCYHNYFQQPGTNATLRAVVRF